MQHVYFKVCSQGISLNSADLVKYSSTRVLSKGGLMAVMLQEPDASGRSFRGARGGWP